MIIMFRWRNKASLISPRPGPAEEQEKGDGERSSMKHSVSAAEKLTDISWGEFVFPLGLNVH